MNALTPELNAFRRRYTPRPPVLGPNQSALERQRQTYQLDASDGVRFLELAPATDIRIGHPPARQDTLGAHRYLWVIDDRGIPFIIERSISELDGNLPKHSNLTGGAEAYVGGEIWFASPTSIYLSGGSGRYGPVNGAQLEDAVRVFESFGYAVTSLGWNYDVDQPLRTWRI